MFHCLFIVLKISLFSMSSSHHPLIRMLHCFFHCFENLTVLHLIQSWSSDQNVPLSFHCFENFTVLHVIQSWSSDQHVLLYFHQNTKFIFSDISCASGDDIYDKQVKNQWFKDGVDLTQMNLDLTPNKNPAKNVILFLGGFKSFCGSIRNDSYRISRKKSLELIELSSINKVSL